MTSLRSASLMAVSFILIFFAASPTHAYTNQWEWRIFYQLGSCTSPTTVYGSKEGAVAAIRTSCSGHHADHLVEVGTASITSAYVQYKMRFPDAYPTMTPFVYGGSHSSSQPTLEAALEAELNWWRNFCGCEPTAPAMITDWRRSYPYQSQGSGIQQDYRQYQITRQGTIESFSIGRSRELDCLIGAVPALYGLDGQGNEYPPAFCNTHDAGGIVQGHPLTCSATVGDPCNVSNGDNEIVETDYDAAGLKFIRYFHSQGGTSSANLGDNWSHNYKAALVLSGGVPLGLVSPKGFHEALRAAGSGRYISEMASGIELELQGGTWIAQMNDGTRELYDASTGALLSIDDHGKSTTLEYSGGNLVAVHGPFGHTLSFQYNVDKQLSAVIDPALNSITYAYGTTGTLRQVTYPGGHSRGYIYGSPSFQRYVTAVIDENGMQTSAFEYDSLGRIFTSQEAGGANYVRLAYASTSTTVTDGLGAVTTYQFTNESAYSRRILSMTVGTQTFSSAVAGISTDFQRRPTSTTDPNGNVTSYTYDQHHLTNKVEAVGTPRSRTTAYVYNNDAYDLPVQVDEPGKRTTYTYNTAGKVLTKTELDITSSESRTWVYTYNAQGQMLTSDGPRTDVADVTNYTYYSCTTGNQCGQINTATNALGHVTTYNAYNAHGQPLTITDPNGVISTLTYDLRQRLTSRTVGSEQTTFEYWPTGLLKKATLPDGSYLSYTYDAAHRLTGITDAAGNRIAYTLDAMGNRTAEEHFDPGNALHETRTRVFNTLNRLAQEIPAAGTPAVTTSYVYDNNGNQTNINAPLSRNTVQAFDELNRLTTVTDPATGITSYRYNALDQLISVTDPRTLATTYAYNALGDLQQQISPDTGTTTKAYDAAGNLRTSSDARSAISTFTYDALNRVNTAAFKIGATTDQTITYSYDAGTYGKGHLTSASDASHSTTWTYDAQGRIIGKNQVVGGLTRTVSYGYVNGQLATTTTPSGQMITYGYTNNRITSIQVNGTTVLSNVLYEPFGPVKGWTWGNATLTTRVYNLDGKVTQIASAGTNTYAYDNAFRIVGITDTANSALSWIYGYDLLDRLTSAVKTGTTLGYT